MTGIIITAILAFVVFGFATMRIQEKLRRECEALRAKNRQLELRLENIEEWLGATATSDSINAAKWSFEEGVYAADEFRTMLNAIQKGEEFSKDIPRDY